MRLTEALSGALRARGATEMFGIPGNFALPCSEIAEETAILPLRTLSREPAVGFAADASARLRGGLGLAELKEALNAAGSMRGRCSWSRR